VLSNAGLGDRYSATETLAGEGNRRRNGLRGRKWQYQEF
jgi:hypothetical protein